MRYSRLLPIRIDKTTANTLESLAVRTGMTNRSKLVRRLIRSFLSLPVDCQERIVHFIQEDD